MSVRVRVCAVFGVNCEHFTVFHTSIKMDDSTTGGRQNGRPSILDYNLFHLLSLKKTIYRLGFGCVLQYNGMISTMEHKSIRSFFFCFLSFSVCISVWRPH